jgi:hypothetical protein
MTVATTDNRLVVSLETLAQARLEPALKEIDVAVKYVERLVDSVDDTGEQYNEARRLLADLRKARGQIEAVEGALWGAVKHAGGEITYYG